MLNLPRGQDRTLILAALSAWAGAMAGLHGGSVALAGVLGAAGMLAARRRAILGSLVVAAAMSGYFAGGRETAAARVTVPTGRIEITAVVVGDPVVGGESAAVAARPESLMRGGASQPWTGPLLGIESELLAGVDVGDRIRVGGSVVNGLRNVGTEKVVATVEADAVEVVAPASAPHLVAGNAIRNRIEAGLASKGDRQAAGLLAGFLIGDTSGLDEASLTDLRLAGLTHFVAVSGGNVALFLGGWWLVVAPLRLPPRSRAATGLVALAVFVVATRWEPSVLRASAMAAAVLGAAVFSFPITAWTALGLATSALILLSGELVSRVGFQLSVLATAGILAGSRMFERRRPRNVWLIAGATAAAQVAVLPLLLLHFGSVPLLSPVANVLAAPLVAIATIVGGVGLLSGFDPLVVGGLLAADGVLVTSRLASGWPQLGVAQVLGLAVAGAIWRRSRRLRVPLMLAVAAVVLWPSGPGWPVVPTLTALNVGQGDALLLQAPDGSVALIDGGPDPRVLEEALTRRGVSRLDLVVATHGDLDHVGGLAGVASKLSIGELWVPPLNELGEELEALVAALEGRGVAVTEPAAGLQATLGGIEIEVLGPLRRFASTNDGSIVLWVEAGESTALIPGDIEAVAQRELPAVHPDVLVVPHHGSATTDLDWLDATAGQVAIISVGVNPFGHPSPEIVRHLDEKGVAVHLTRDEGDVSVPLDVIP